MGYHMKKNILKWSSKIQRKKGTPYIALHKDIAQLKFLEKVNVKLVIEENTLKIEIPLDWG